MNMQIQDRQKATQRVCKIKEESAHAYNVWAIWSEIIKL